jgi:hypothetical protein
MLQCWTDSHFLTNYKDHWLPGLSASQRKTIRLAKQNYHLSPMLLLGGQNFLSLRNTSQNREKSKFTKSWTLTLDSRAEVCKCIYVYLHFIKSLKFHIRYTDSRFFILHLSFCPTPGVVRQSYWPNLGRISQGWETLFYAFTGSHTQCQLC